MSKKTMSKKERKEMNSKRSQVTIFIIIAILIVAVILIFFLFIRPRIVPPAGNQLKIEKCVGDSIQSSLADLAKQGGFANPQFTYQYMGDRLPYFCYTNLYYRPCVVQVPFLKQSFESELTKAANQKIDLCYDNAISELKAQGYEVNSGERNLSISLEPGRIVAVLNAPVSISQGGGRSYTGFKTMINSEMYDIVMIATSIVQSEAKLGNADTDSLRLYYPNFIIQKLRQGDESKVYIIQDKNSKIKYQFATRSYAWPAGYGASTGLAY